MRRTIAVAVLAAFAAAESRAAQLGGHNPDPVGICAQDVVDDKTLIAQSFFWMKDQNTVDTMVGKLAAHLVCKAKDEKAADPCKALDRMQPAYKFDKTIGTLTARCRFLSSYSDFWWEVMTANKNQRRFPACIAYLDGLKTPVQFFDVKAKAPRSLDTDPSNDGGFWNVCKVIGEKLRAGKSDFCDERTKHYLSKQVPPALWKGYCEGVGKLWLKGDESFCDLLAPNDEYCRVQAVMTRAFKARAPANCPPTGVERGACIQKLSERPGVACKGVWNDLKDSYCSERARTKPEDFPKPPKGAKKAPGGR